MKIAKRCPKCKKEKPLVDFGRDTHNADGFRTYCRPCVAEEARQRRAKRAGARKQPKQTDASTDPLDFEIVEDVPLIERAHAEHREARASRELKKEHAALLEENAKLRSALDVTKALSPKAFDIYAPALNDKADAVACVLASDWHVEEPVEAAKVHGLNEYSLEIAEKRARRFFQNSLRLAQIFARESSIKTLWAGFIGDLISNYIHEELRESNLLGPAEAANFVLGLLHTGIKFWQQESDFKIVIDAVPGNHGRMTAKPRIQNATETSLETFLYASLARHYEGSERVSFRVAGSKMLYRNFFERFRMRIIHGDDVKFGGGIGGITIPIRKKLAAWDKAAPASLTVMGHFHQLMDGGDFVVNGSLIGYNEFAQAIGASPEAPKQAFFLVHARNGGEKSVFAPIWVDD